MQRNNLHVFKSFYILLKVYQRPFAAFMLSFSLNHSRSLCAVQERSSHHRQWSVSLRLENCTFFFPLLTIVTETHKHSTQPKSKKQNAQSLLLYNGRIPLTKDNKVKVNNLEQTFRFKSLKNIIFCVRYLYRAMFKWTLHSDWTTNQFKRSSKWKFSSNYAFIQVRWQIMHSSYSFFYNAIQLKHWIFAVKIQSNV